VKLDTSPFEPGTLTARKISTAARIGSAEIVYAFDTATEFAPLTFELTSRFSFIAKFRARKNNDLTSVYQLK
jgi:hypothetical protein